MMSNYKMTGINDNMMSNYIKTANEMGATIEYGINWTWANHFATREKALEFIVKFPEMETRGIYTDTPGFSVRFR